MTEMLESVSINLEVKKCCICDKSHGEPKEEKIEEVAPSDKNWQRKSMQGIFEKKFEKLSIYPNNLFPPFYSYQGHHCLALSAFTFDSNSKQPKDKNKMLNHFLKKVGFFPNRDKNCIGLPARRSYGAFGPFWEALDSIPSKPLQFHGPGHDEKYFSRCNRMIAHLLTLFTNDHVCKETPKKEMEDRLKKLIEQAENYAFIQLCSLDGSGWDLHPAERKLAEKIYVAATDQVFDVQGANNIVKKVNGKGNGGKKIQYPSPSLDTGPY